MVLKRKAVASGSKAGRQWKGVRGKPAAAAAAAEEQPEWAEEEEAPEEEEPEKAAEEEADEEEDEEEEEEEEKESPEEAEARQEEETVKARRKELKGFYSDDLKKLAAGKGLEISNKAQMVEAVVAHEAAERAAAREHAARMRAAVTSKKEELESMAMPQLRALCQEKNLTGMMTKQARVEQLLKLWQEDDGVPKALAKMAQEAREAELAAMDKPTLRGMCEQVGVNPFVKEIMADRLVKCEMAAGQFKRPLAQGDSEQQKSGDAKETDIVEALLSGEATRKKEKEQKKQREEAAASKRKELKAMSNEQLNKLLSNKGLEAGAKKDEMVDVLYAAYLKDEEAAARRAALKAMPSEELKRLVASKGLAKATKKEELVASLMAHEGRLCEEAQAYEAALREVCEKRRQELEGKSNAELKELCVSNGMKPGLAKEDRIERLLEHARTNGEMDEVVMGWKCTARREELLAMDLPALEQLIQEAGADALVKEVMVERLLSHETTTGSKITATSGEPAVKKARKK